MSVITPRDPYLDLPLHGVQLIEASAGTGKTYTLATLVTRLVVERGLRIGQILAVTFTEAATQELRKRIRERLQLTLALLDAPASDDETPEAALTRALLQLHRARGEESDDTLRRRLRQATLEIDLAAIFTIHGFCARVLREHALESGQGFAPPGLLTHDGELREALAADLWRAHALDDAAAEDLGSLWPQGHDGLARDLQDLLRVPVLLPADAPLPPDPQPVLYATGAALAQAYQQHGDAYFADVLAAVEGRVLNGNSYRVDWLNALSRQLSAWCEAGDFAMPLDERIARLTAEAMQSKANKGKDALVPVSPFSAQIVAYANAVQAQREYIAQRRLSLLHRLREDARARLTLRKRQLRVQTYDDLIDDVAGALAGNNGDALARGLRQQYAVALVDEFQDTDARQWAIFRRVFGDEGANPALFAIGDPKQAIYGFRGGDVQTYLDAAAVAERAPPLSHNFRSRPALLRAIAALYANAGNKLSTEPGIDFQPVEAGGKRADADYRRNAGIAPSLTVWQAPATGEFNKNGEPVAWSSPKSRTLATDACVAAIHRVLSDARAGKAMIDGKPVQPGDIAVLVRSHREATMIQQALALVGIAAVAAGKQSLFATFEARELHVLLLALLHSGDDGRLRTALSTVLVGVDAVGVDALDRDPDAHRHRQQQALGWRERLLHGGPLALVGELCAAQAQRLLGLLDGERRMSNYLQLAERLQEAQANALGLHGLAGWLGQRIADADADDDTQLLRLESDARRVQIVTLHKSKGLEYPLVFLPFVGIGGKAPTPKPGKRVVTHRGGQRALHWPLDTESADWNAARQRWLQDQEAEDARLLYVGLTRAEHALWLASGALYAHEKTPLHAMLRDADALAAAGIVFDAGATPADLPRLPPAADAPVPPARTPKPLPPQEWWVHSFSQLAKADAGVDTASASTLPARGGNDEPEFGDDASVDAAFDPRFAGNRYGVALHAALEHADFAAWRDWHAGDPAPDGEASVIAHALGKGGYAAEVLGDGVALTTQLIGQTLTAALPEGVRLCEVAADERRAEIEFQFALRPTQVEALLTLLHAHGVVRERHGFGLRHRLEGLMTGLIDLTYRFHGKWYVLDYKSNRLAAYDHASLRRAMAHGEYDLQALIYTLALHRWLRFRLGDAYDYARDFGGIRYVFCRGLDASLSDSPGIHAQRFAPKLVAALDALFGHADARGVAA
jgi:exodeoxyribonuclease V beta subunit